MSQTTPLLSLRYEEPIQCITITGECGEYSSSGGWFKLLDEDHKLSGIQIIVPFDHPNYDRQLKKSLMRTQLGEIVWMKLSPENSGHMEWKCEEIFEKYENIDV